MNMLITQQEVVEIAFMPRELISQQAIRPIKIDIAQQHFIRPQFGDKMFQKMVDGEYELFVHQYIKPALAHFVRYGVVEELSIQMSDNGAVVFSSENREVETDGSKTDKTVKTSDLNSEKTTEGQQSGSNKRVLNDESSTGGSIDQTEVTYTSNINVIKESSEASTQKQDVTDTSSNSHTGSEIQQAIDQQSTDKTLTDKQLQKIANTNLTQASAAERRAIMRRALADANVLIGKAVRYVQQNPTQFADYIPMNVAHNIFF